MTKTVLHRVGEMPFLGVIFTVMVIATYLAEIVFGMALALRVLEVASVFTRWMPGFTAWEFLAGLAIVAMVQWGILRIIRVIQTTPFNLQT